MKKSKIIADNIRIEPVEPKIEIIGLKTPTYNCETCRDTGWYGDNGPGRRGNREYVPCDCEVGKQFKPGKSLERKALELCIAELRQYKDDSHACVDCFNTCDSPECIERHVEHFLSEARKK